MLLHYGKQLYAALCKRTTRYYLEITPSALHCVVYNAQKAQWITIPLPQAACLTNKLGNLNALVQIIRTCMLTHGINPQKNWVVCAPHLAACPQKEKPFALLQLLLMLTKADIHPTKIITTSCSTPATQDFNVALCNQADNELSTFKGSKRELPLFLLVCVMLITIFGFLYLTQQATDAQQAITTLKETLAQAEPSPLTEASPLKLRPSFYEQLNKESSLSLEPLLAAISHTIPDNCVLNSLTATCNSKNTLTTKKNFLLSVTGSAQTTTAIALFTEQLNANTDNHFIFTLQKSVYAAETNAQLPHIFTLEGTPKTAVLSV